MVEQRSPKPLMRVRFLLLLPLSKIRHSESIGMSFFLSLFRIHRTFSFIGIIRKRQI